MDTLTSLIEKLSVLLEDFDAHPQLIPEIYEYFDSSTKQLKGFRLMITDLQILSEHRSNAAIVSPGRFEKLRGGNPFYSMHMAVIGSNLRLIYCFEEDRILLLHLFYERSGKRASNYTHALAVAESRRQEISGNVRLIRRG